MGKKYQDTIGSRIRELRLQKNMTQKELSEIPTLRVQRNLINYWENDERDIKSNQIIALANYFGVTCDEILRGIKSENVGINEKTGLRDKAIETLEKLNGSIDNKDSKPREKYIASTTLRAINYMLENEHDFNIFMLSGRYFWDKYTTEKRVVASKTGEETSRIVFFNETAGFTDYLMVDGISSSIFVTLQEKYMELKKETQKEESPNGEH